MPAALNALIACIARGCPRLELPSTQHDGAAALQGTKLLFYNSAADVLLLDLPSAIPDRYKPFYVGEALPLCEIEMLDTYCVTGWYDATQ